MRKKTRRSRTGQGIKAQSAQCEEPGEEQATRGRRVSAGRALLRKRVEARRAPQERAAGEPNVRKERSALPVKHEASAFEEKTAERRK
ncbi:hypothetical protein NDU88_001428 [Pleurodeles waltl]|uniref:Uncharacterized protein n=1 Tax=Pleurodeles waltl TaxID=8319 RepID=A0AAV7SZI1_PLEWA|nr:hypothetical protein NDU88_001428 [Pleurodeles waltl]